MRLFVNRAVPRGHSASRLFGPDDHAFVSAFYAQRPELLPTPLHRLGTLAASIGLADLLVKDESDRYGLPAFKIAGVELALAKLEASGRLTANTVLACATAGNHGRAVAHAAARRGLRSIVYLPEGTRTERIHAVAREGGRVVAFSGSYDEAVKEVASQAAAHGWQIVSDTAWPGYDEIPRWIMLGYTRMFDEAQAQWPRPPDVVVVQAGVGGLAAAAASWWNDHTAFKRPTLICAEPTGAACLFESARAAHRVSLTGRLDTIMEGLRCAEASTIAWPVIASAMDGFVLVSDDEAREAMERLAHPPPGEPDVRAGPSGACGLAALIALMTDDSLGGFRQDVGLGSQSTAMVIVTEGP